MNTLIKSVLTTRAGYGLTLLRVIVGIAFIAHGSQKLFGAFGGYGLEGTAQYMESLGLTPGYLMALMSGSAEFFGGVGLLLGLLARPAAVVVIVLLLVAIFTVHIQRLLHGQQRLRVRTGVARRRVGGAHRGRGQTVAGPRHRSIIGYA